VREPLFNRSALRHCGSRAGSSNWVAQSGFVVACRMRHRIVIPPRHAVLVACAAALVGLVYAEGWTWPLKAAAVMIPVSFLVG